MSKAKAKKAKAAPLAPLRVSSPFPAHSLFDVWDWALPVMEKVNDDFGPTTREDFVDEQLRLNDLTWTYQVEGNEIEVPLVTTWGVWRGEELGGFVMFKRDAYRVWTGDAHTIFKRSFWGWPTTVPALVEIARQIFRSGIKRIGMSPFETNHTIRSLISHIGAVQEGTLRSHTIKDGKFIDVCVYGLMETELENAVIREKIVCI